MSISLQCTRGRYRASRLVYTVLSFAAISSIFLTSNIISPISGLSKSNNEENLYHDVAPSQSGGISSHRRLLAMPFNGEAPPAGNYDYTQLSQELRSISNQNYQQQEQSTSRAATASAESTTDALTVNKNNGDSNSELAPQIQHGQSSSGPGVIINMMRRAKDIVSESDVPFLLQIPHTSSETIYNIMTQCYGLVGKHYDTIEELDKARRMNVVDNLYVSSHDRPAHMFHNFGRRFHFLSTPHYQEGASLLTKKHKGRIILMMRHPAIIAESMYLTRPGTERGDMKGLIKFVNRTDYYDNWMTRMLANVPPDVTVTEEHFRDARMILENKFLIGMTADMTETVKKRLGLYFGWKELPDKQGCEMELIKKGSLELPNSALEEGGRWWNFIAKRNHFDRKLYARAMAVFGNQKMRVPVHSVIREEEKAKVVEAFGHLKNIEDERDSSDLPFFWHIPKASGTTVKETLSDCYGLVRTEMIKPPSSLEVIQEKNVLNVDLTTPESVEAARREHIADQGLADVFVSQLSLDGSTVFTTKHMGRAFTIMRHPVKLAASLFYYRRIATWEPTYRPDYKDMTLQQYVAMDGYYDNWMVRMLTNAKLGGLNEGHLELAKLILKKKFIIGISDHMDETFRHLELYYGWAEKKEGCVNFHLHSAPSNKNKYPSPERGSDTWNAIADKNRFDMALYYYALELFGDQSEKMFREEKTVE